MSVVPVSEASWQETVVDLARLHSWKVAHFRPARTARGWRTPVAADGAGFPDLVLVRERVLWVELKADTGRLTADQRAWLEALHSAGCETYVWRPSDWDEVRAALAPARVAAWP